MDKPNSLDLDIDGGGTLARIAVVDVEGYTRTGDPVISVGCESIRAMEREVERLKNELDDIVDRARESFGGSAAARRQGGTGEAPVDTRDTKPRLDASLTVGDVMTRDVMTVRRNDRISVAEELMRVGRFRHVVVLEDRGDTVAGVLSQRDIVYGALAWTLGQGRAAHDKALESFPVKEVMAADVRTIDSAAPLGEAAATMRAHQLGCLPVVDADELVGILTEADFLYLLSA